MASKRKGKEIVGSPDGVGKKKAAVRFHGIEFKNVDQRKRYNILVSKPISTSRYPDGDTMIRLGIRDNVVRLLDTLGWTKMLRPMRGYENFTYEFLSSLAFTKDRSNSDNPDHKFSFRLLNNDYEMSIESFCETMGFSNVGFIHDSWDQNLKPVNYDPVAFWTRITGLDRYNACSNKDNAIHNPVLIYIQRVMACTIWGRKEVGPTRTDELFMLWDMLNERPVNTCYYLLDHLYVVAKKKSDDKGEIVVGGIIIYIGGKFGVGFEQGINRIEGNNRLDLESLILMFFVRPFGEPCMRTYVI